MCVCLFDWLGAYYKHTYSKQKSVFHYAIMTWACYPRYWPFVRGNHLRGIPRKGPTMLSFHVLFDVSLNTLLNKLSICRLSWDALTLIWRHWNVKLYKYIWYINDIHDTSPFDKSKNRVPLWATCPCDWLDRSMDGESPRGKLRTHWYHRPIDRHPLMWRHFRE